MSEQPSCIHCGEYLFERDEIKKGAHVNCKEEAIQTELQDFIDNIYKIPKTVDF